MQWWTDRSNIGDAKVPKHIKRVPDPEETDWRTWFLTVVGGLAGVPLAIYFYYSVIA